MNTMLNFNKPKKETLMYGLRPCAKNHTDMQGRVVRRKSGSCWACSCGLPDGKFNYDFGDLPMQEYKYKNKHWTAEDKRKARVEAQMRWNERNPEKMEKYRKKYESRDDIREKRSKSSSEYYQKHKQECIEKRKIYYEKNKEYVLAQCKARYERNRDEHKRQKAEREKSSTGSESVDS